MTVHASWIIIYVLVATVVILALMVARMEWRFKQIFKHDGTMKNVESVLMGLIHATKKADQEVSLLRERLNNTEKRLLQAVRKVHTIRYNPFSDQGGNHSFATTFLSDHGDGVVFSSIYSRDKVSVYAKPIINFKSTFELTAEERQAIEEAQKKN